MTGAKRYIFIVVSVVLVASIIGVVGAFALPAEIEEQITLLNYEQRGKFDYDAYLKASYLYDNFLPATDETAPESTLGPPATPKYPVEMVDWFEMTFRYQFLPDDPVNNISQQVEVSAVVERPDADNEEIILVPARTVVGDFTTNFRIDADDLEGSSKITITADVYTTVDTAAGLIFESFTQALNMDVEEPLIVVDNNLTSSQEASYGELGYEQIGTFDYYVRLKPDSPFGAVILKPPQLVQSEPSSESPSVPLSSKIMKPGDPLFLNLIDRMDMRFSYNFMSDQPVSQVIEEVEIIAVLENPDVWSKTFVLVPRTERNGNFTINFTLSSDNLSYFQDVFDIIQKEAGGFGSPELTIKANVYPHIQSNFGPIIENFSQTISTELTGNILEWGDQLTSSTTGAKETSQVTPNPSKILGLSISEARIVFPVLTIIFLALFLYLMMLYWKSRPERLPSIEEEAIRARKKHQDVLVDVEELPEAEAGATVISYGSLDELVKTADSLLKPVLHKAEPWQHTYCVIDGSVRYEYVLTADSFDDSVDSSE